MAVGWIVDTTRPYKRGTRTALSEARREANLGLTFRFSYLLVYFWRIERANASVSFWLIFGRSLSRRNGDNG